jgi:stearoyl-CoA desaturase (delta-9 desaturase)
MCVYLNEYSYLLISVISYYIVGILGINIAYHRLLSHRSFSTYTAIYYFLTIIGAIAAMGSPLAWVMVHRQHHRYSDTDPDPHSPHKSNLIKSWLGFCDNVKFDLRNCRDLRKNKFHRFVHKNYISIQGLYVLLLALIDPILIIFVYAIPAVMIFHSAGALNVIGHIHGYRNYNTPDKSKNSWIANIITMGEGWHNNHHAKPWEWNNRKNWWEIDITSLVIRLIKK